MQKKHEDKILLETAISKEWLITNGIGGYASSTIVGCNTRKYHGLLVAPLNPPALRYVILSKIDESIEFNNNKYNLYTNICKNSISRGYQYLVNFDNEYIPNFTYKVNDVTIKKNVCMEYGKNIVCILYKIKNGNHKTKLTLAPIINYRNAHIASIYHQFDIDQEIQNPTVKVALDRHYDNLIHMKVSEGNYIKHDNDIFNGMFYLEEEKRGLDAEDNLVVPGCYEININENEEKEISFVCSLNEEIDDINAKSVITNEILRLRKLISKSNLFRDKISEDEEKFLKQYIISADNFIAYRQNTKLHTILAGFPWFLDWGRDSLISFEGLLLMTNRFDIAKEVLLTFTNNIRFGLVPNGFSDNNNIPLYNSVDASLLLFEQINKYIKYTGDIEFVKSIYIKLQNIIEHYIKGIDLDDNNIYLDEEDGLISSGTINTQNTWMDVKYDGYAVTPRNGKAVEINALWYNALKTMEQLTSEFEGKRASKKYKDLAEKCKESFNIKFYNDKKKCLYDVLGDGKVRPNQLFSLSLTYPVVDINSDIAKNIISTVEKKLLTKYGLRTLAKDEPNYVEIYEGDSLKRDFSYHQGPVWTWLLGLYYNALRNMLDVDDEEQKDKISKKIKKLKKDTKDTFMKSLYSDGILGSIAEIYDTKEPFLGKGAPAQAWSVAEVYRIILS